MFDIGFWELLVIGVVALLVLGPERLPSALRSVQRTVASVKQFGSKMHAELNHELRIKELHDNLKKIESMQGKDQMSPELQRSLAELESAAAKVQNPYQDGQWQDKEEKDESSSEERKPRGNS
ncbi:MULTISPECIES: Sec-independent protein translocase protein TatB [Gammaproteobacteria]|uniref:Sec-independent protein translocase protein TatB n=1 Tax=Gammaproteobacteria TaxID=1236 RepID=UPI000DD0AD24|nr:MULTISPECIES: Sec-independent protein translocase protein TatB [Gammaproteobacteria]RTE85763.1 twin-arginine translocase subunit TatB [Aliidiomarina sp. B3213]TCZ90234.1 twin-arginine translocase subunit TatB [Lysobacter sp. N42]